MPERYLVFDCETIPDLDAARRLLGMPAEPDNDVRTALGARYARNSQSPQEAFVKVTMQKVAALSLALAETEEDGSYRVRFFGTRHLGQYPEAEIVAPFCRLLGTKPNPVLVGFNTSGFDVPLLRYRAMALGLTARELHRPANSRDYFHRYRDDHIDLCVKLSGYGATAKPSLAELCAICDIPAKIEGMDGSRVESMALEGRWDEIAAYCESDVVALYFLFLRYQLMVGELSEAAYRASDISARTGLPSRLVETVKPLAANS